MRNITRIFVHCTASWQESTTEKSLRAEFKAKGWKQPGYHYVVKPDGTIIDMLPENEVANGVKGYNANSIHVSWIGGLMRAGKAILPCDNRTPAQKQALYDLLSELKAKYKGATIMGHRDISPDKNHNGVVDPWERIKQCPCFDAMVEYKDLNNNV